jgi:hypothetical protein
MQKSDKLILVSAVACIIASIGEFISIFVLGLYYPGYNQWTDTMSSLGASISPVSDIISTWWIIMGVLFIFFGIGYKKAFQDKGKNAGIASLLIILYGLGEGIGSGSFKADHIADVPTTMAIIHDILGGIGVTAILAFPLIVRKVITKEEMPGFSIMSKIIFVLGILSIILFLFRFSSDPNNFLSVYKGLWQRLFMLNTYIYLSTIAIIIIRKVRYNQQSSNLL